ncbi:hypothetical protein FNYG_13708 [Fusarium nygamai]|uniref:F-box domain-containing protein n=1 Tax=Gibberella nygamai TaxID=42673 RepID=A0A2K0UUV5_GIBNY|nr:hypothetical protein FNYG_13708 [Fusarium nygamai]
MDGNGSPRHIFPVSWVNSGVWPEFEFAISRICDMPNLDCLDVRFSSDCDDEVFPAALDEPSYARKRILKIISKTLRDRESRPDTSIIRELVLNFLEDAPLPKDLTDNLLQNIERLHIALVYNYDTPENLEFSPYLSGTILPSVSERLVELTIAGHCWGSIPAEFNGKGLSFPCLKTLTLGDYIILRQDQFDWILEQPSLTGLNLYRCKIATHCLVQQPDFEDWGVNLNGWKRLSEPSTNMGQPNHSPVAHTHLEPLESGWYANGLRWSGMFDRIRQNLPRLRNFVFSRYVWENYSEVRPEIPDDNLETGRYCIFEEESWGWVRYWPAEERPWLENPDCFGDAETPEGLDERTEPADRHALETLMEATRKRRDISAHS